MAVVRPFGADPSVYRFPTTGLYSAPLLRVKAGGDVIWLDPSTRLNPFGAIPGWLSDCEALVLPKAGERLVLDRTPGRKAVADGREVALKVTLGTDGTGDVLGTDRYHGVLGGVLKSQLEPLDADQRRQALESMLSKSFQNISISDFSFEGEDAPSAPLTIRWKGRTRLALPAGGGLVIDTDPLPARLGARYVRLAARTTPLLFASPEHTSLRLEIVPPAGLRVAAEPPVRVENGYGSFVREDSPGSESGSLVRDETLELFRGRIPPDHYLDFASFAASVDSAQERPIRITP